MAKIVKTGVQEAALKAVQGNLRAVAGINMLLDSGGEKYGITFMSGRRKVFMVAGKALGDGILGDVRRKLAAETCLLARKHSIRLEEQELAVLENKAARTAGKEAGKDAGERAADGLLGTGEDTDAASGTCDGTGQQQ
ncbi:MAG: hypothetical protein HFG62_07160 [Lachnospiraceae bacterium]|jgi:hypothetical protein|nr:hypothetical protein [Lachnospiraceae bacterium]MCI8958879.1 hypothetical protein [Lachnospiraceae bacterium]